MIALVRRLMVVWRCGVILGTCLFGCLSTAAGQSPPPPQSVLLNGSFESVSTVDGIVPHAWSRSAWLGTSMLQWDSTVARDGVASVRITSDSPNDAMWIQTLELVPDRPYLLSGWIKTDQVVLPDGPADAGANLSLFGGWITTTALSGTHDWTYVRVTFNSGPTGIVTIAARLGFFGALATGTAWFDEVRVRPIVETPPRRRPT